MFSLKSIFALHVCSLVATVISFSASIATCGTVDHATRAKFSTTAEGQLRTLEFSRGGTVTSLPFRTDQWGTGWYVRSKDGKRQAISLTAVPGENEHFEGRFGDMHFGLAYAAKGGALRITATVKNMGKAPFEPMTAGIRLGFDSYQVKYPTWNKKLVPNVLRCEPTHHWGFAMSPNGNLLAWVCPTPVASWSINYEPRQHRIFTANIDFINQLPLPQRHPQNLATLAPGQSRSWTVSLLAPTSLKSLKSELAANGKVPLLDAEQYTVAPGEETGVNVFGSQVKHLTVIHPDGKTSTISPTEHSDNRTDYRFSRHAPGLYTLRAQCSNGKVAEGSIYVRKPWRWYLENARIEGLRIRPTATHHAECVYPFYSYYLAAKHFPNPALDARCEKVFQDIFPKHFDVEKGHLHTIYRIQDTATWAGILADRYAATGDKQALENAASLVDWLVDVTQKKDGAYRAHGGKAHYTSVIYIAKSIMEVMKEIKPLAATSETWRLRYNKYHASVRLAIADLNQRRDNVKTEGQQTYEDGMISCTLTQLAMFALKTGDSELAQAYTESAEYLFNGHRCLTLAEHPDARVNGATIRFWETQYTICLMTNLYNSPCGWSAWKLYGDYYLYLLTGKERYLQEAFNGLGACMQLMDASTARLRWGFTPEPFIHAKWAEPADKPTDKQEHKWVTGVRGEEYLEPISDWNRSKRIWRNKWGIDNFSHEVFKCMEEMALCNAYVIERDDGSFGTYNCKVMRKGDQLVIKPMEATITRIHLNLKKATNVSAQFGGKHITQHYKGMGWFGPGGTPPDLVPFATAASKKKK